MRARNREDEKRVERFLKVLRNVEFRGPSDDEQFLSGFYEKLRQGLGVEPLSLGAWCWKMAPVTGLASLLFCLTFLFGFDRAAAAPDEPGEAQVLTLLSESLEGDTIVELILHEDEVEP
jgi:hypothetical protein